MDTHGGLWRKGQDNKKLRAERKQKNQVLEDIKNIFVDTLSIEVDEKKPILYKLVESFHKFNKDTNGKE